MEPELREQLNDLKMAGIEDIARSGEFDTNIMLYQLLRKWEAVADSTHVEFDVFQPLHHPDMKITVNVYKEDGHMWLQFRFGYDDAKTPIKPLINFHDFVGAPQHNPLILDNGRCVPMRHFFVAGTGDQPYRYGDHGIWLSRDQ